MSNTTSITPEAAIDKTPPVPATKVTLAASVEMSASPKATVIVPAELVVPVDPAVARKDVFEKQQLSAITEQLDHYEKLLSAKTITQVGFHTAAATLSQIIERTLITPTPVILDTLWNFFNKHKDGIFQQRVALSGVESLRRNLRGRIEIAYTLLRQASDGVDVGDPRKINATLLQTNTIPAVFIVYLQGKSRAIANGRRAQK